MEKNDIDSLQEELKSNIPKNILRGILEGFPISEVKKQSEEAVSLKVAEYLQQQNNKKE